MASPKLFMVNNDIEKTSEKLSAITIRPKSKHSQQTVGKKINDRKEIQKTDLFFFLKNFRISKKNIISKLFEFQELFIIGFFDTINSN